MTDRECRPPEGTDSGTWHWIDAGFGREPALWIGPLTGIGSGGWNIATRGVALISRGETRGFRYVGPCVPPEEGA